jgi:hypothetical protein
MTFLWYFFKGGNVDTPFICSVSVNGSPNHPPRIRVPSVDKNGNTDKTQFLPAAILLASSDS